MSVVRVYCYKRDCLKGLVGVSGANGVVGATKRGFHRGDYCMFNAASKTGIFSTTNNINICNNATNIYNNICTRFSPLATTTITTTTNNAKISTNQPKLSTYFSTMANNTTNITYSSSEPGPVELSIAAKLQSLDLQSAKIFNDSYKHASHHGMRGAENTTESHFRLEIVSNDFKQYKNKPSRHRLIYNLLNEEMTSMGVHALQLKTQTPEEAS